MFVIKGKKALCEFIGSFFFILTINLSVVYAGAFAPIAIGFMLMAQVFAFGYISGAHFNPAVTLGVVLVGQLKLKRASFYVLAQTLGGIAAGLLSILLIGDEDMLTFQPPQPVADANGKFGGTEIGRAFLSELIFTCCLVTVVLHVACSRQRNNNHYGLAIGMTVMSSAFSVGKISGGGFNPAVSTGLLIGKCIGGSNDGVADSCQPMRFLWLYWLAPFIGSVLASGMFLVVHAMESEEGHIYEDELNKELSDHANAMDNVNPVRASTYGF